MTNRAEQGQPELLGVLVIALHLHDSKPVPLTRTVGPGAQQRRLAAAGRSRDDRHLARHRAIQSGEKIVASDQPASAHSAFPRLWLRQPMDSTMSAASASANDHEAASGPSDGEVSSGPITVPSGRALPPRHHPARRPGSESANRPALLLAAAPAEGWPERGSQRPDRVRLSWLREVMSNLVKTLPRWYCTVRGDRNSRVAISRFDSPSAASRAIC